VGRGYRHDGNRRDAVATAVFSTILPEAGRYEVRVAYSALDNRSSVVRVAVDNGSSVTTRSLNQKQAPPIDDLWASLGTFDFPAGKPVSATVSNEGANGHVIVDAVQWLLQEVPGTQ
jgi:hypothetical protein